MQNSKIQWCDHTFNPWIGCTKVSPGCVFCYAENETFPRVQRANGKELWGKGKPRHRTSAAYWKELLRWNANETELRADIDTQHFINTGILTVERPRVFCASLSDWLDDEVPIEWLADLLKLIYDTPNLDWLLLTKRPQNFDSRIRAAWDALYKQGHLDAALMVDEWRNITQEHDSAPPKNVWIGTSVEDQQRADERIPELIKIPARVRFLSVEPMLGPIDFGLWPKAKFGRLDSSFTEVEKPENKIHWTIFGGESGSAEHARPCNVDWIMDAVRQCQASGVKTFVKQLGRYPTTDNANTLDWPADTIMTGEGDGFAACRIHLHDKKGGDMSEWPEDLRRREFPNPQS